MLQYPGHDDVGPGSGNTSKRVFEHSMEKTYDPSKIEQTWYRTWEENGYLDRKSVV